ncbi:MAG: 5-formyltetrahydrofolate cyclo-ligase, partial [Oscillospiraceae bacterium]|nr:5-formyltetrahydrofolate cyclo-ligase [Oscillospiraceae bacterium]
LARGKRIAVPLVESAAGYQKMISPCEIKDVEAELAKGCYGILEPVKELARRVPPENLDMVIVPGVAFDLKKNRIGYGGGYYDRFLKKMRFNCLKVGIAFEFQIVPEIPASENDVPVDIIVTEKRIIK